MSQVLYEAEQMAKYRGKKLKVVFSEEYFDSVPRPIDEERSMLKEDIQRNGLLESIKVNVNGVVLDGHTRIEIGDELGWKKLNDQLITPKFEVKEFVSKEEERNYVIKTNLLRRHLNAFQKVRLVARLYKKQPNGQHALRAQHIFALLVKLKEINKPIGATELADHVTQHRQNVLKLLNELAEDYSVRRENKPIPKSGGKRFMFSILPRGEEIIAKGKPERITIQTLSKSVGVGRDVAAKAIFCLNEGDERMLRMLEDGKIGVFAAYTKLTNTETVRLSSRVYLKNSTKVICPHCEKVSMKSEWKKFNEMPNM